MPEVRGDGAGAEVSIILVGRELARAIGQHVGEIHRWPVGSSVEVEVGIRRTIVEGEQEHLDPLPEGAEFFAKVTMVDGKAGVDVPETPAKPTEGP